MRQTPRIKDTRIRVNGKIERVFQGITLKGETGDDEKQTKLKTVTTVPDVTVPHTQESLNSKKVSKDIAPVTNGTPVTPSEFDVDSLFPKGQFPICFSCHKPIRQLQFLTTIDGKPIHKKCKAEIEAQKKKLQCKNLITKEGQPFCNWLQSFLAEPKQCGPDCDAWEVSS
jgi:hypothetical protein